MPFRKTLISFLEGLLTSSTPLEKGENLKIFIFDGTGPYSDEQYGQDFCNSFCSQILRKKPSTIETKYYPGPGTLGCSTYFIACKGFDDVVAYHRANPREKIFLVGYSRGGVAAMDIAKWCKTENKEYKILNRPTKEHPMQYPGAIETIVPIPIEGLFLLDPVDKDPTMDGNGVESNVKNCYVMYRDQMIIQYDAPIKASDWDAYVDRGLVVGMSSLDPDRYARKFMNKCNVAPVKGNSVTKYCFGKADGSKVRTGVIGGASHGAIGGLPWIQRRKDQQATAEAADTLNSWLTDKDLGIKVWDNSYTPAKKNRYPEVTDEYIRTYQKDLEAAAIRKVQQMDRQMLRTKL